MGKVKNVISNVKTKFNASNCKKQIKKGKRNIKQSVNGTFKNKKISLITNHAKKVQNLISQKQLKLKKIISTKNKDVSQPLVTPKKVKNTQMTLRERMMNKLKAARFRYLNEKLYLSNGKEAYKLFQEDPDSFEAYHLGFNQQITQWPINPLDVIINSLNQKCENTVIADFGCGDAKLAATLTSATVHSFDLVALNDRVTVCNMSHTKLPSEVVDVAVFCLSLMGTNLNDFIKEANRVLKEGGILKIAEVESRFDNVNQFVHDVEKFGFKIRSQDLSHDLFYFLDFLKISNISKNKKKKLPRLSLKPCFYKKR